MTVVENDNSDLYSYKYPHPAVTVDCVVFGLDDGALKVLLIKRLDPPFEDSWALPGGFIKMDEDLQDAAFRELREETGVAQLYLEQFHTYGRPGRDPRERVITIAYFAIVNLFEHKLSASTDAKDVAWFPVDGLPALAFDHGEILRDGLAALQYKVRRVPLVFEFLPQKFTLPQLQQLYETILREALDKRNFRKKLAATGVVDALEEHQTGVSHRAARYHVFHRELWEKKAEEGEEFKI